MKRGSIFFVTLLLLIGGIILLLLIGKLGINGYVSYKGKVDNLAIAEDQNNSLLLFCSPEYSYRQT